MPVVVFGASRSARARSRSGSPRPRAPGWRRRRSAAASGVTATTAAAPRRPAIRASAARPAAVERRIPGPEVAQLDDERDASSSASAVPPTARRTAARWRGRRRTALREAPLDAPCPARDPERRERQRLGPEAHEPEQRIGDRPAVSMTRARGLRASPAPRTRPPPPAETTSTSQPSSGRWSGERAPAGGAGRRPGRSAGG